MFKRKWLTILPWGLCILLTLLLVVHMRVVHFADVSVSELKASKTHHPKGVYLVCYADGADVFYQNQNTLVFSALKRGVDFYHKYQRHHLDAAFVERHQTLLNNQPGVGLWIWKPYVVLKTMTQAPDGALILYMDVGSTLTKSIQPLIKEMDRVDMLFSSDMEPQALNRLERITPRSVFQEMGAMTQQARQAPALWAGFFLIRNTPQTRAFVKKWLDACTTPSLIQPTMAKDQGLCPDYKGHSYDQTLLGVLLHQSTLSYRVMDFTNETSRYASWHHRHTKTAKDLWHGYSLLRHALKDDIRKFDERFFNNKAMAQGRHFFTQLFNRPSGEKDPV